MDYVLGNYHRVEIPGTWLCKYTKHGQYLTPERDGTGEGERAPFYLHEINNKKGNPLSDL